MSESGKPKRERGRPTKYEAEFCAQVVEWGRLGKSRAWICASLGITRPTMLDWISIHPDFSDAMAYAKLLEQQWWEDQGQENLATQGYQQSMWSRSMAARFPDDWRERSESTTTHDATDKFASLLSKVAVATESVFPGDDASAMKDEQ